MSSVELNQKILHIDINKYQRGLMWSEKQMNNAMGICKATRYRISVGKPITMETFLKCISFLDTDVTRYFRKNEQ